MSREENWEQKKKKDIRDQNDWIKVTCIASQRILDRDRKIKDPVARQLLFVKNFVLFLDAGMAALEKIYLSEGMEQESRDAIDKLRSTLESDIESLMDWIQTPHYSPDHPIGEQIMKRAHKDFENHV